MRRRGGDDTSFPRLVEALGGNRPARAWPSSPLAWPRAAGWAREALAAGFLVALGVRATQTNGILSSVTVPMPAVLAPWVDYPRIVQGWHMFTPDMPRDDGMMVVDAVLADGRHVDPFTGQAPDFDMPRRGPVPHPGPIIDYLVSIHVDHNQRYRRGLWEYLARRHEIEGRPAAQRIVSFEAWWIGHATPPPGSKELGPTVKTLITSGPLVIRSSCGAATPSARDTGSP
jgi:hypothetical protein